MGFNYSRAREERYPQDRVVALTNLMLLKFFEALTITADDSLRIEQLSNKVFLSYNQLSNTLRWCAVLLHSSVKQCLDYVDNDIGKLESLAYSAYATKHWEAKEREPLQSLTAIPET